MRTKPGAPPLNEQSGCPSGVDRRNKEERQRVNKRGAVLIVEGLARQLLFQPVGDAPAVELVLQTAIAVMEHDAGMGLRSGMFAAFPRPRSRR